MRYFISLGNNLDSIDDFIVTNHLLNKLLNLKEEENCDIAKPEEFKELLLFNVKIIVENKEIVSNINFKLQAGEKIAVIGENGSGKSIFVKTLLGFYDHKGEIYFNYHHIDKTNKQILRSEIAFVPEDPFIFSGTVKQNIDFENILTKEELQDILNKVSLETI